MSGFVSKIQMRNPMSIPKPPINLNFVFKTQNTIPDSITIDKAQKLGDLMTKLVPGISEINPKIVVNLFKTYDKGMINISENEETKSARSPSGIMRKVMAGIATRFPKSPKMLNRLKVATAIGNVASEAINVVKNERKI